MSGRWGCIGSRNWEKSPGPCWVPGARGAGGGEVAAPTQVQKPFVKQKRAFRGLSCWQVQASPSWVRALPSAPLNSRGSLVSHGFS